MRHFFYNLTASWSILRVTYVAVRSWVLTLGGFLFTLYEQRHENKKTDLLLKETSGWSLLAKERFSDRFTTLRNPNLMDCQALWSYSGNAWIDAFSSKSLLFELMKLATFVIEMLLTIIFAPAIILILGFRGLKLFVLAILLIYFAFSEAYEEAWRARGWTLQISFCYPWSLSLRLNWFGG